jgi:penicillin-binding protein 1A
MFWSKNKTIDKTEYYNSRDYRRKLHRNKRKRKNQTFSIAAILGIIAFILLSIYLGYLFQGLPSLASLENPKTDMASKLYSEDGVLIDQFFIQNRTVISIDNVPKDFINALIATEDRKFYNHWGVDIDRIVKAAVKNIMSFEVREGASTITQQLARNLYASIGTEISFTRKIREAITAIQIEKTYTKEEILLLYINQVYFGRGAYGIEAAAQTYFDKTASELTLDESAILVGILKSPSQYNPVDNPEESMRRRNIVLSNMLDENYISNEIFEIAKNDPIKVNPKEKVAVTTSIAPQFSEFIRQALEKKAEKYGFDIYRDGLIIKTTLDSRFQKYAVQSVTDHLKSFQKTFNSTWNWKYNKQLLNDAVERSIKQNEQYKNAKTDDDRKKIQNTLRNDQKFIEQVKEREIAVQVGFVVIDPRTGHIKAMVGQNPNYPFKYGLNHVTQIKRQPGSSFKPFVYTTALENGYSPGYSISNDPLTVTIGGRPWSPKGGGTGGSVTLREAIAHSINIVAVRTAMEIAPIDQVIRLAIKMGIKSQLPNVLSLALGVGEVSPLEMTSAFGSYPNLGIWVEPIAITRIEDRFGNLIEEIVPESREVLSEGVAFMMSDMMQDVVDYGTAASIRSFFTRPAAGKTGTTQDFTDAWFVGFTPQLVAGVWVGFDDQRIKFGGWYGQGGKAAAPIWGRFMKLIYDDKNTSMPMAYFEMPPEVEEADICTVTGLKSNGYCPSTFDIILRKFAAKTCNVHTYDPYLFEDTETSTEPPPGSIGF